ncbi:hypothetical protein J9A10_03555 [Bacteroides thetaiotaomicron]|nr:hypothetical protein [Bacteroides thetaiotaomicron]
MRAPTPAHKDLKGSVDKDTEFRPFFHAATGSGPLMSLPHRKNRPNGTACVS